MLTGDCGSSLFTDAIDFWEEKLQGFFEWVEGKIQKVQTAIEDAAAYFTGDETSADKARQQRRNSAINAEFEIRTTAIRETARIDKAIEESDRKFDALMARQALEVSPGFDMTKNSKSHVMIELVGDTDKARVRSIKSDELIDVKTGNQGG